MKIDCDDGWMMFEGMLEDLDAHLGGLEAGLLLDIGTSDKPNICLVGHFGENGGQFDDDGRCWLLPVCRYLMLEITYKGDRI
jgi:hypothetical protein